MFGISPATTGKASPKAVASATIFLLALLAGCTTHKTAQTVPSPAASNVCNADTDTFCLEGDKDSGARLNRQGLEYAAKKDYVQALDLFKRAIELDNPNPEYHYNLGVTYSFLGNPQQEEAAYMNVLAIEPDDPKLNPFLVDTYFNLACLYALQGKKDQAFVHLEKLFSIGSNSFYHRVQSDTDLDSLRDDPRYNQLVTKSDTNSKSDEAK